MKLAFHIYFFHPVNSIHSFLEVIAKYLLVIEILLHSDLFILVQNTIPINVILGK